MVQAVPLFREEENARKTSRMRPADLIPLLRHMEWADALMWRAVLALPPDAQRNPELKLWLHHIHLVQRVFLSLWKGAPMTGYTAPEDYEDLPALARWAHPAYAEMRAVVAGMDEAALAAPQHVPHAAMMAKDGVPVPDATRAETVVQVAMHTAHHRGQIAMRVRALGGEPKLMDFVAWVWKGKPEARWPEEAAAPERPETSIPSIR